MLLGAGINDGVKDFDSANNTPAVGSTAQPGKDFDSNHQRYSEDKPVHKAGKDEKVSWAASTAELEEQLKSVNNSIAKQNADVAETILPPGFEKATTKEGDYFMVEKPTANSIANPPPANEISKESDSVNDFSNSASLEQNPANDFVMTDAGIWAPEREQARVECPYCHRKFNEMASKRHIPKCKEVQHKPKPPPRAGSKSATSATNDKLEKRRTMQQYGRVKKKENTASSASNSNAKKDDATCNSAPKDEAYHALENQWGQVQILLTKGIEAVSTEENILETLHNARRGLGYTQELEHWAGKLGIMKGKLSRYLLPFNSNTDAKNQANVSSAQQNGGSPELDKHEIPMETRVKLVQEALNVRKFLRVKVSDDSDLDLLKDSLRLIMAFFQNLDVICNKGPETIPRHVFITDKLGMVFKHKFREG